MKKSKLLANILFTLLAVFLIYACPSTTKQVGVKSASSPNTAPDHVLIDSIKKSKGGIKSGKVDTTSKSIENH